MSNNISRSGLRSSVSGARSLGWFLAYGATILAMATSAAFGALSLVSPTAFLGIVGVRATSLAESALVFASYTGARELAIAVTLLALLVARAPRALAGVMLLTGLANLFDAIHALLTARWVQAPGALVFAIIYLAAAWWLFTRSSSRGAA